MRLLGLFTIILTIFLSACGSEQTSSGFRPQQPRGNTIPPPPTTVIVPMPAGAVAFGGFFSNGTNGSVVINPFTGAANCPVGFTTTQVFGSNGSSAFPAYTDQSVFICTSNDPNITQIGAFGGMFSTTSFLGSVTIYNNPITNAQSCPANFAPMQILGSANDNSAYYCYAAIANLHDPLGYAFGAGYGRHFDTTTLQVVNYLNPASAAASCPLGFTKFPLFGTPLKDYEFDICLETQNGGILGAPATVPSMIPAGLKGTYYAGIGNTMAGGTLLGHRVDNHEINYGIAPDAPMGCSALDPIHGATLSTNFSVQWMGYIVAPVTGTYTFTAYVDDGVTLTINNSSIISQWSDHDHSTFTGSINLTAGQLYPIELNFYNRGGEYAISLRWSAPGVPLALVPASAFYHIPF